MLDKKVFSAGLNELKAVFPNWNVDLGDPFVLNVWYKSFKHMDNSNYKSMVSKYMKEQKFAPTIAGLYEYKEEGHYDSKSVDLGDVADEIYDDLLADYEGDKTL